MRWLKEHPFTIYGLSVLSIIFVAGQSNPQYDDGAFGMLYHFVLIPVLGFMFYLPHETLSSANGGKGISGQLLISLFVGLSFCAGADYLFRRVRQQIVRCKGISV